MDKVSRMRALHDQIITAQVCPDLCGQATQLVIGDGDLDADIVFIGEAPGKNEDQQGIPFVGAAGKLLDEMLAAAGVARRDVYITNIVKYRPPNNRDPSPEEKAAFWPYLLRELEIIEPKVIVTLGRHSGGYFISDLQISNDHGNPRQITIHGREWLVVPLYHPAAALYNRSLRQTLVDDFQRIPRIIEKIDG